MKQKTAIPPLSNIQDKNELANALRDIIARYVSESDLSIEVIADVVELSTRSLQRMMRKHGLSYSELVNEARKHYALEKLNIPSIKVSDIACQLGYKDAAHFTRAFKRWTGVTPSQYRKT